jgi:hypothetical protein
LTLNLNYNPSKKDFGKEMLKLNKKRYAELGTSFKKSIRQGTKTTNNSPIASSFAQLKIVPHKERRGVFM